MTLYETIPYPSLTHSYTHPDRLAVIGRLMGLRCAPSDACRVLDLGCGNGANLLAMAELLPESRFVGIDLAARQIEDGRQMAAALRLENVELRAADILDLPDRVAEFDYVIAHGLFSWVPDPVREKALQVTAASLAPHGLAYFSYNAYPGWYQLSPLRDMMRYHTRDISDPVEKAFAARDFIAFLAGAQPAASPAGMFLRQYYSSFQGRGPVSEEHLVSTLLHDELSDENRPFYFHEFVERASRSGLEFLAEADLEGSTPVGLEPATVEALRSYAGNALEIEQYLDFVRNRGFRRTLVCRAGAPVSRELRADRRALEGLFVGSFLRRERRRGPSSFVTPDGLAVSTDSALVAAALDHLSRIHPAVTRFEDLVDEALKALPEHERLEKEKAADLLAGALLRYFLHSRSLVELYVSPRPVAIRLGRFPRTTGYARLMASKGEQKVPNVRHEQVQLSPTARQLVPRLDGKTSVKELETLIPDESDAASRSRIVRDELRWLLRTGLLLP